SVARTRTCATRSSAAFAAAATPRSSPSTARWWPSTWTTARASSCGGSAPSRRACRSPWASTSTRSSHRRWSRTPPSSPATGQTTQGQALLERMLDLAWQRRADFLYKGAPLASQIAHARTLTEGPVILVDHGDNTASGGTQDVMNVVAEVMRQRLQDVLVGPICDPTAVARIVSAGTVASVTLDLGGRI